MVRQRFGPAVSDRVKYRDIGQSQLGGWGFASVLLAMDEDE
jgi:hypothetical protein